MSRSYLVDKILVVNGLTPEQLEAVEFEFYKCGSVSIIDESIVEVVPDVIYKVMENHQNEEPIDPEIYEIIEEASGHAAEKDVRIVHFTSH